MFSFTYCTARVGVILELFKTTPIIQCVLYRRNSPRPLSKSAEGPSIVQPDLTKRICFLWLNLPVWEANIYSALNRIMYTALLHKTCLPHQLVNRPLAKRCWSSTNRSAITRNITTAGSSKTVKENVLIYKQLIQQLINPFQQYGIATPFHTAYSYHGSNPICTYILYMYLYMYACSPIP